MCLHVLYIKVIIIHYTSVCFFFPSLQHSKSTTIYNLQNKTLFIYGNNIFEVILKIYDMKEEEEYQRSCLFRNAHGCVHI